MRKIEILAPGGDLDSIKAAIAAGADAVYCGIQKFNARNRASNISFEELQGILILAHKHDCKVFLTLNILIMEQEIPDLMRLLNRLVNTSIDGVIVQDLGLCYLLSKYYPDLEIHASTQLTTHNEGQIKFLKNLSATRVNLSRELNLNELSSLSSVAHEEGLLSEVFVHGSYCISFSGLCYMSSLHGGNSGNRGRCSQPCRDRYLSTPAGSQFPLNLKDNSAWLDLKELSEAGVDSIKIEGRIKKFHYVYTVVKSYRQQVQRLYKGKELSTDMVSLRKTFNRDFSNGFLLGKINRDMYTDNPRDIAATEADEFTAIKAKIKASIDFLQTEKIPMRITVSGKKGEELLVEINSPESSFMISSEKKLTSSGKKSLNETELLIKLKAINETAYFIEDLDTKKLPSNLHIPFSELTSIRNQILFTLNDSREHVAPVKLPVLKRPAPKSSPPALSVLISSREDLNLLGRTGGSLYFQLPEALSHDQNKWIGLFKKHRNLIPWFPSILIGKEYKAAVNILRKLRPTQLVINNTGIAFEAYRMGIPWIAGPFLNLTNSYSLLALKEQFNCEGAFISNELSRKQIRAIKRPDNFDLYFSIYHPIELMTSRQCLFQQTSGCEKEEMDESCLSNCQKSASLVNLKKEKLFITKEAGSYNRIFHETNLLNTEIAGDRPDLFTGFLIDIRDILTSTSVALDKGQIVDLFEGHLQGRTDSAEQLRQAIHPSNEKQYNKGI